MSYEKILVEKRGSVAIITLNHPEKLNVLDMVLCQELAKATKEVREDQGIRAVVITGAGKNFCAGGDLQALQSISPEEGHRLLKEIHSFILDMVEMEKPVIAAVNGAAAGAGFNLALAADLLIAEEGAKFTQAFVKIGVAPDAGGTYILPRLIGPHLAKQLFFTGELIDAKKAKELGIVSQVVPDGEVLNEALSLAEKLAAGPTRAIGMTKRLINKGWNSDFQSLLKMEGDIQELLFASDDFQEGASAFFEKRNPQFKGN
ncbi:enoyl-CoA hydratase-related protein [Microaerobacter geothermalis]|uniref:enoyl-CoA hydratase/isomerase family protein n=1 Tax=Microaerobacter geothermalis TaxID=674972 RepID=UPI001F3DE783|nr:enoyl-CoA hydratase-related protein [Microaerobacter geothermalis]MCF6094947.1 enoyl-CoA hydratase-related protein [Microaerobacter geothermalis]